MPKIYAISAEEAIKVAKARKDIRDKLDKRLHAVQLRGEGKNNEEIAVQLETSLDMVTYLQIPFPPARLSS